MSKIRTSLCLTAFAGLLAFVAKYANWLEQREENAVEVAQGHIETINRLSAQETLSFVEARELTNAVSELRSLKNKLPPMMWGECGEADIIGQLALGQIGRRMRSTA